MNPLSIKIRRPAPVSDQEIVATLQRAIQTEILATEPDDTVVLSVSDLEVLVYDQNAANAAALIKWIGPCGLPLVRRVTNVADVLMRLRRSRVGGLLVWCQGDSMTPAVLMQEVMEMRDLHRILLIPIFPTEEVMRKFVAKYPHCLFDGCVIRSDSRQAVTQKLWQIWGMQLPGQEFINALYALRHPYRRVRTGGDKNGPEASVESEIATLFRHPPHYLSCLDHFFYSIRSKEIAKSSSIMEESRQYTDISVDPIIAEAMVRVVDQDRSRVAQHMIDRLIPHRLFSEDKAFVAAKLLLKWGALSELNDFLLHWSSREDYARGVLFHVMLSHLHRKLKDGQGALAHMKHALMLDPLGVDQASTLLRLYEATGNSAAALGVSGCLSQLHYALDFRFKEIDVKNMVASGDVEAVKSLIKKYVAEGIDENLFTPYLDPGAKTSQNLP